MDLSLRGMVSSFQSLPPEGFEFLVILVCCGFILTFLRFFGAMGLYVYVTVAVIVSNLQALKAVQFSFFSTPFALGTPVFASTIIVSDILTESYGASVARKAIGLSFLGALMINILMFMTISIAPLQGGEEGWHQFYTNHKAMEILFLPGLSIWISSIFSYICSQYLDIFVFQKLKRLTQGRFLWLRANAAAACAACADSIIFSTLAWKVLAPSPVGWHTLFLTYVLGSVIFRLIMAILYTPVLYSARYCMPRTN